MPAVARISESDVERAVDKLVAEGHEIGFRNGRVVGVSLVRRRAGGGDHDRVRSMVILILAKRGIRIPAGERQRASDILGRKVRVGLSKPRISERRKRSVIQAVEQMLSSGQDPRVLFPAPGTSVPPMPKVVTQSSAQIVQKDDGELRPPVGGGKEGPTSGIGQKPMPVQPRTVLAGFRERRAEAARPKPLEINFFAETRLTERQPTAQPTNEDS